MKVQSGVATIGDDQDDEVDDDDEDESDDDEVEQRDEDIKQTAENLKVFCVSSTEYLKLRRKLSKDGPAQVTVDHNRIHH